MLTFHEKYYLIIVLNNWIEATRQKKLAQVQQKVGKVSGTAKKQLEEHFETNELN